MSAGKARNPIKLALIVCLLSAAIRASAVVEFEVQGVMQITPHRTKANSTTCRMRLFCRDCQWAITQTWEVGTNRVVRQMSDDGKNIYIIEHIEALLPNAETEAIPNSWVAQIHRSGFPCWVLETEAITLFYAYASTCYLDTIKSDLIDPIKVQPSDLLYGNRRVKAWVARNHDSPRLPNLIGFFDYSSKLTNTVLRAESFTNIAGFQLPNRCLLRRYDPRNGKKLIDYEFHADELNGRCSMQSFTLNLPKNTYVSDYRFSHGEAYVPAIVHPSASGGWPTEDQSKKKKSFAVTQRNWEQIQMNDAMAARRAGNVRSVLVRIVLALFLLAPLVIFWALWRKKNPPV
jgi:hypothetical protein